MGSQLAEKITRLAACPGLALYRWTSTTKRVGGMFIPLPELRLNILTSSDGTVHLSVAAPVLVYNHGRPSIVFYDECLMHVTSGPRTGINVPADFVHDDESAVRLKGLAHRNIGDDAPEALADKVLTMGNSRSIPQTSLLLPDTFRITRHPENIRPVYTKDVLKAIGGAKDDTPEQLQKKFLDNVAMFSDDTGDGYVFPNELIATGGMPCVTTTGISRTSGSLVLQMPLFRLEDEIKNRGWHIHIHEQLEGNA